MTILRTAGCVGADLLCFLNMHEMKEKVFDLKNDVLAGATVFPAARGIRPNSVSFHIHEKNTVFTDFSLFSIRVHVLVVWF